MNQSDNTLLLTLEMAKRQINHLDKMLFDNAGINPGGSEITLNRIENEIAKIAFQPEHSHLLTVTENS